MVRSVRAVRQGLSHSWTDPFQLVNAVVVVAGLVLFLRSVSRARFRQVAPFVVLLATAILAYTFVIAFGRSANEVAAITYYSYVFSVLAVPLVYALVDFERLRRSQIVAAAILLCGFAAIHAIGTAANARGVGLVNRDASLFLTRVSAFVDEHGIGTRLLVRDRTPCREPRSDDRARRRLPGDPGNAVLEKRVTEILFSPDYSGRDPKYLLSASAESRRQAVPLITLIRCSPPRLDPCRLCPPRRRAVSRGRDADALATRGVQVTLACATRGEAGKPHPSVGPRRAISARIGRPELRRSCEILEFNPPRFLGFRDSARKERLRRDDPRALVNVDMLEVEAAVLSVIHESARTSSSPSIRTAATIIPITSPSIARPPPRSCRAAGRTRPAAGRRPGCSTAPSPSTCSASMRRGPAGGVSSDGLDPEVFAVSPSTAAVVFDARPVMDRKLAAFAAHQSAFGVSPEMLQDPPPEQARRLHAFAPIMETEVFTLGAGTGPGAALAARRRVRWHLDL